MDGAEVEPAQDYSMEENENILKEQQKNGHENKSGAEKERESVFLYAVSAFEKESVMVVERSELRKNSEMTDSQVAESLEEGNSNDLWVHSVTRSRRSQVEEQQVIRVKPSTGTVTQPVIVDCQELRQLLHFVTVTTENFSIFDLEKLYAVLSNCIYQHRKDYDKTKLVKEMKKEIAAFSNVQRST